MRIQFWKMLLLLVFSFGFYASLAQPIDTSALESALQKARSTMDLRAVGNQLGRLIRQSPQTVIRLGEMGLDAHPEPFAQLTYLDALASAHLAVGEIEVARSYLAQAEKLAKQEGLREFLPSIALNQGVGHWKKQEIEAGLNAADKTEELAKEMGDGFHLAKAQQLRGWLFRLEGKNEEALTYFDSALVFFEKHGHGPSAAETLNGMAAVHYIQENLAKACELFLRARDYAAENGLTYTLQNLESNLGFLYLRLEQMDKAKAAMYRSLALAKKNNNMEGLGHVNYNLAEFYFNNHQLDSAKHFANLSLEATEKTGDRLSQAGAHMVLCDVALAAGELEVAAWHARRTSAIATESEDIFSQAYGLFLQGQVASQRGNNREAISYFTEAIGLFQQTGELSWEAKASAEISQIHEKMGNDKLALEFFKASTALQDSLKESEQLQKIAAIEKQFELEKKEEEIEHLQQKNELHEANSRKNRWIIATLVLALALAVLSFILAYRQRKLSLEKGLAEVKQSLLRQQMNPHFIFNALNSIQNQFLKGDAETSVLLMGKFSRLMRLVLNNSNETFVPIHDELELLRLYLDLEQLRTNRKFDYEIKVDETVDVYNVHLPSMVTQIFVENAIWHGIAPKPDRGKITLSISRKNGFTIFSVLDDGVGRQFSMSTKTNSQRGHRSLGTQLVRDRIEQLNRKFAKNIRLLIEDVPGQQGEVGGTKVNLVF